jgi:surface protein
MESMFGEAANFTNQDLSSWNVSNVVNHNRFFDGAGSGNIEPIWNP